MRYSSAGTPEDVPYSRSSRGLTLAEGASSAKSAIILPQRSPPVKHAKVLACSESAPRGIGCPDRRDHYKEAAPSPGLPEVSDSPQSEKGPEARQGMSPRMLGPCSYILPLKSAKRHGLGRRHGDALVQTVVTRALTKLAAHAIVVNSLQVGGQAGGDPVSTSTPRVWSLSSILFGGDHLSPPLSSLFPHASSVADLSQGQAVVGPSGYLINRIR
jgi:hypothetical protein